MKRSMMILNILIFSMASAFAQSRNLDGNYFGFGFFKNSDRTATVKMEIDRRSGSRIILQVIDLTNGNVLRQQRLNSADGFPQEIAVVGNDTRIFLRMERGILHCFAAATLAPCAQSASITISDWSNMLASTDDSVYSVGRDGFDATQIIRLNLLTGAITRSGAFTDPNDEYAVRYSVMDRTSMSLLASPTGAVRVLGGDGTFQFSWNGRPNAALRHTYRSLVSHLPNFPEGVFAGLADPEVETSPLVVTDYRDVATGRVLAEFRDPELAKAVFPIEISRNGHLVGRGGTGAGLEYQNLYRWNNSRQHWDLVRNPATRAGYHGLESVVFTDGDHAILVEQDNVNWPANPTRYHLVNVVTGESRVLLETPARHTGHRPLVSASGRYFIYPVSYDNPSQQAIFSLTP